LNPDLAKREPRTANRESVAILRSVIDAMVDHARRDAPLECCGLLAARHGTIDEAIPTRNLKASPVAFLIDPLDHVRALKRTRTEGREVIGAYHSHPRSAAIPSPTDRAEAHYEEFLYVIVSLTGDAPDVRAYHLVHGEQDSRFVESRLAIQD
jgi:proteasome lid subunit RPN8/RPN11